MKQFADLFTQLDQTNKTNEKIEAMRVYFTEASDEDKVWALYFLSGRVPKRQINSTLLREWATEKIGLPVWLMEESYHSVGDLAETFALLLPPATGTNTRTLSEWMPEILTLKTKTEAERKEWLFASWDMLTQPELFVFNKLLTGGFRIGVSQKLVIRALSLATTIEPAILAHRLMGNWEPDTTTFTQLVSATEGEQKASQPYPFYLAYPIDIPLDEVGTPEQYAVEWKWDGIRGQLIVRNKELYLWSRGEELVTDRFPEFQQCIDCLPDGTVLDGEILAWKDDKPLPFGNLQTRIGRKAVSKKVMEDSPVGFMVYDLLELNGEDIREKPFRYRREQLEKLVKKVNNPLLHLSPLVPFTSWEELEKAKNTARENLVEGLFLKKWDAPYQVGRKRGDWWKWKIDPHTIDAVLIYAQKGHGRRADLFTDYTFAVWDGDKLVPFAKAYSGLTDQELKEADTFIRKNTKDKFGPVRTVAPTQVFELAFEGIQESNRHKSGVAVRFPRILRWRHDKKAEEADTLADLQKLLKT